MAKPPTTMTVACPDCGENWPPVPISTTVAQRVGPPYGVSVKLDGRTDKEWVAEFMETHSGCVVS